MESEKKLTNLGKKIVSNKKPRKGLLWIFIIILVTACIGLVLNIAIQKEKQKDGGTQNYSISNLFENLFNFSGFQEQKDEMENEYEEKRNNIINEAAINSFNLNFKSQEGIKNAFFVKYFIDDIYQSNKQNPDHLIILAFNGRESSDNEEIIIMRSELKDSQTEYDITLEYDKEGYVNKVILKEL